MKSLFLTIIISLIYIGSCHSQSPDNDTTIKDFNQDQVLDTMIKFKYHGSGFGGITVLLINGKTSERFELSNWGSFANIFITEPLPPDLMLEKNKTFYHVLIEKTFPKVQQKPDNSLKWLLDIRKSSTILKKFQLFDWHSSFNLNWSDTIAIPQNYSFIATPLLFNKVYREDEAGPDWYSADKTSGVVSYYAHNHKRKLFSRDEEEPIIKQIDSTKKYKLYKTSHGLIIQKNNKYAWVFLTDYHTTGGPEKLRWPSIEQAIIKNNLVFLNQSCTPDFFNQLFIIDIESGQCFRYKGAIYDSISIVDDQIFTNENGEEKILSIDHIIEKMNDFNKN